MFHGIRTTGPSRAKRVTAFPRPLLFLLWRPGQERRGTLQRVAAARSTECIQQLEQLTPASSNSAEHMCLSPSTSTLAPVQARKGTIHKPPPQSKRKRATRAEPIHKPAGERGRNERSPLFCMSNTMYYVDRAHQISKSISEPVHASESLPQCSLSPCVNANIHLTRVQPSPTTPPCLISRFPPAASVSQQRLSPAAAAAAARRPTLCDSKLASTCPSPFPFSRVCLGRTPPPPLLNTNPRLSNIAVSFLAPQNREPRKHQGKKKTRLAHAQRPAALSPPGAVAWWGAGCLARR